MRGGFLCDIYHLLNQTSWNKEYCFSYLGTSLCFFFFMRVFFSLELKNIVLLHQEKQKVFTAGVKILCKTNGFLTNKLDKLGRVF